MTICAARRIFRRGALGHILKRIKMAENKFYHGELSRAWAIWRYGPFGGKYMSYRLPGVVVTKKGTVIVYCEARTHKDIDNVYPNLNDFCLMDIVMQRSTDGGLTFDEGQFLAFGNTQYDTMNNPIMIVDNDNVIHFLHCKNCTKDGGGAWYRRSVDDGVTWSEPRRLDEFITAPKDLMGFGPGHGLCTEGGRLIVPFWTLTLQGNINEVYTLYSDDGGETWHTSEKASANKDETTVAQLSDGRIMLNSRNKPRRITVSADGATGWSESYDDPNLIDPFCMGGMETVRVEGLPHAILFVNCADDKKREKVTVKCSFDDGKTWRSMLVSEFEGGYADVAVDEKTGKGYVIYETFMGTVTRLATFSFYDEFCK